MVAVAAGGSMGYLLDPRELNAMVSSLFLQDVRLQI